MKVKNIRCFIGVCVLLTGLVQAQFIEWSFPAPSENISGLAGLYVLDSLDCLIYVVEDVTGAVLDTIELPPLSNPAVGLAANTDSLWFAESGTAIIHAIDYDGNLLGSWDFSDTGIQTISGIGILSQSMTDYMYLLDSSDRSVYVLEMPIGSQPIQCLFTISHSIEVYDLCAEVEFGIPIACNDEVSPVRIYNSASHYEPLGYGTYASAVGVGTCDGGSRFWFNDPEMGLIHRYCVNMGGIGSESSNPIAPLTFDILPNPALMSATLSYHLVAGGLTSVQLYDVVGRVIWSDFMGYRPPGYHNIILELPGPGVYFVRMTSGDVTATQPFTVIE